MIERKVVGGIFFDLQKVFDCVKHNILLGNIEFFGVTGTTRNTSYLEGRYQKLILDGNLIISTQHAEQQRLGTVMSNTTCRPTAAMVQSCPTQHAEQQQLWYSHAQHNMQNNSSYGTVMSNTTCKQHQIHPPWELISF
jgi:hypothetical protein